MRGVDNPVRSPMAARWVVPRFAVTPLGSPPGASVKELESIQAMIPFAIVGSEKTLNVGGQVVRGRRHRWGIVNGKLSCSAMASGLSDGDQCGYLLNYSGRCVAL